MHSSEVMIPRERVLAALAHQQPDRTPFDFWAEEPAWNRILQFAGHNDRERLLKELGIDIRHLDAPGPAEHEVGDGVFQNFWGERYTYRQTPWGPMREDVRGALADASGLGDLESFSWPSPDDLDHSPLKDLARKHEEYGLIYGFADVWQRPGLVRGWEQMFLDMKERPEWSHFLCRKFTDFYIEDYTRAAEATNGRIDLYLLISDLGMQHGPLISRMTFLKFVAPYLLEMIDHIHGLGARVMFHSCGMIRPLIPVLIELGVDVLDPIQPTGPDMAPGKLKTDFGEQLCFHGGIDLQRLLPQGNPDEVRATVRHYCETLGEGGGYILAPSHFFQPDVPPENVMAVYQALSA